MPRFPKAPTRASGTSPRSSTIVPPISSTTRRIGSCTPPASRAGREQRGRPPSCLTSILPRSAAGAPGNSPSSIIESPPNQGICEQYNNAYLTNNHANPNLRDAFDRCAGCRYRSNGLRPERLAGLRPRSGSAALLALEPDKPRKRLKTCPDVDLSDKAPFGNWRQAGFEHHSAHDQQY